MSTLKTKDGDGNPFYLGGSGSGSSGDPFFAQNIIPSGAAQDGTDISSPTAMPSGGVGIRGWLSAIWTKLNGSLGVTGTFWPATQPVSAASLPLPSGAAQDGTDITSPTAMPAGGGGIRGWLSAIWTKLNGVFSVGGQKVNVSATFTRPADTVPYTAGDIVSNSTSSTTMMSLTNFARVNGGSGYIVGVRLMTDLKGQTVRFRVHLFSDNTATVSGDNLPGQTKFSEIAKRLGSLDLPAMNTSADATNSTQSGSADMTVRFPFVAGGSTRTIYAVLEVLDAFTPASAENFTLVLVGDLD